MSLDPTKLSFNFDNFFPHLIIHPKDADENDRNLTWAASIILGIFTVGLVHLGCAIYEHYSKKAEVKNEGNRTEREGRIDNAAQEALGKKAPDPLSNPSSDPSSDPLAKTTTTTTQTAENLSEQTSRTPTTDAEGQAPEPETLDLPLPVPAKTEAAPPKQPQPAPAPVTTTTTPSSEPSKAQPPVPAPANTLPESPKAQEALPKTKTTSLKQPQPAPTPSTPTPLEPPKSQPIPAKPEVAPPKQPQPAPTLTKASTVIPKTLINFWEKLTGTEPKKDNINFPAVTFSREITDKFPLPAIFLQKCVDEKSGIFQPLAAFLKSLPFDPPINFDEITPIELLMTGMLMAQGHYMRSDEKDSHHTSIIQLKTFEVLDPLMVQLYNDDELPILVRQELKSDYFYRVGCFFEHSSWDFKDQMTEEVRDASSLLSAEIKQDKTQISALPALKIFVQAVQDQSISKRITLKISNADNHMGSERFQHAISSLGFEKKFFPVLVEKLFLKMEKVSSEKFLPDRDPNPNESNYPYAPKLTFSEDSIFISDEDKSRIKDTLLILLQGNEAHFKAIFEKLFPDKDFEAYKNGLSNWRSNYLSPAPAFFEIPLLAEAFKVKVDCYHMDEKGHFSDVHYGPREGAAPSFTIASQNRYRDGYFLTRKSI